MTIGSDIARGPNTPRPPCRGYLHKRTQSGLIKGWRKRWFVLTHDSCLYYFKNKRQDEGKRQPLSSVKLEGAEVGPDDSLGKPFVFKCRPQFGSRLYSLCATSNQEMKWCEAMERAVHPITQNHVWVDVTRHNSNMPPLAVKNPDCLGLLNKLDRSKDTWVQHYCILKDACLYLYSGIRSTGIYLQGYAVREQAYGSKKSTIELKPPSDEFKSFYFCADNSAENKWILAIKASIKKWRPFHQVLQDYMSLPPEETRM
uniref:PDZ and pleckstrin homology domains 1 n=1 Tax=Poecilia latipinna TaxID=48699 RepID=A0A3B3UBM5_9TELE